MAALAQGCSGTIAQTRVEDGPVLTDTWFAAHGDSFCLELPEEIKE